MDSLVSTFGFDPVIFHSVLSRTGCFIAGGAPTHILRGGDAKTFDGDIDIWYPHSPQRDILFSDLPDSNELMKINAYLYTKDLLMKYIESHGYLMMNDDFQLSQEYTTKDNVLNKQILKVLSYKIGSKRIQLIFGFGTREEILNSFDYSFCAVGYRANKQFFGNELELTRTGKGYAMNPARTPGRDEIRRKKYEARGFTIIEKNEL